MTDEELLMHQLRNPPVMSMAHPPSHVMAQFRAMTESMSAAADVIDRLNSENSRLRKANIDMGWELNPDRMGGQFTEEEMNRSGWL